MRKMHVDRVALLRIFSLAEPIVRASERTNSSSSFCNDPVSFRQSEESVFVRGWLTADKNGGEHSHDGVNLNLEVANASCIVPFLTVKYNELKKCVKPEVKCIGPRTNARRWKKKTRSFRSNLFYLISRTWNNCYCHVEWTVIQNN